MTPAEETQEARHKLGLTRAEFAKLLGVRPAQVRKWETEGQPDPSAAALAAMRMAVALDEERKLPWMTPSMWDAAQNALHDAQDMLGRANSMDQRRCLTAMVQLFRALLERRPK